MNAVLLENLPPSFSEATLASIIGHVQLKGRILASSVVPEGDSLGAHVHFEKAEDAEAAIRLWDQLTIDNVTISATNEADTKRRLARSVSAQHNSGLRYPFAPMNIGWLFEFVNGHKNPQKSFIMCHVLECLMCNAVATTDPFMEHAVVHFYTKFSCTAWSRAQGLMADGISFELCRQVFEVIGLIRRYPNANPKSRKMLLTLVERVVDDISKVTISTKASAVTKAIPEVITSVRSSIATLRAHPRDQVVTANDNALTALFSWLKFLFTCLSSHHNQVPAFPDNQPLVPCSESCPCFRAMNQRYPTLAADVEKVKVIDALVVMAGRDGDDDVADIARDLMQHYHIDFCTRAVAHVHNGQYAILRLLVFEALRFSKRVQQTMLSSASKTFDVIEISLLNAQMQCADVPFLNSVASHSADGLRTLVQLRIAAANDKIPAHDIYALQYTLQQMFTALCAPNLMLCVHDSTSATVPAASAPFAGDRQLLHMMSSRDAADAEAQQPKRCGNPACTNPKKATLLKCSACKGIYYCSAECQKSDWRRHKVVCKVGTTDAKADPNMAAAKAKAQEAAQATVQKELAAAATEKPAAAAPGSPAAPASVPAAEVREQTPSSPHPVPAASAPLMPPLPAPLEQGATVMKFSSAAVAEARRKAARS